MRAWVVGSGASLGVTPLEKLQGEVSFAVNRIRLIYPRTTWRCTDYLRTEALDDLDIDLWREDVLLHLRDPNIRKWLNPWFLKKLRQEGIDEEWQNVSTLKTCSHYLQSYDSQDAPFNWHSPVACSFGSSVNTAINIAVLQGYSPIYLVGCDMDRDMTHFDDEYQAGYNLRSNDSAYLNTLYAHMIAKRSSPVEIYDATIGGKLGVYPRVSFDSLF